MSLSTWALNTDKTVAVSRGGVYWMPIDENTPRNVKVFAIARHQAGIGQPATIRTHGTWFTHWHPLPQFREDDLT